VTVSQPDRPTFPILRLGSMLSRLLRPWDWWRRIDRDDDSDDGGTKGHDADQERDKVRVQARVIRRAFDGDIAAAGPDGVSRAEDDADALYFFRPGYALVREERLGEVTDFFIDHADEFDGEFRRVEQERPLRGLVAIQLPPRRDGEDEVLRTLKDLESVVRPDGDKSAASPDHILYVTNWGQLCPYGEPEEPPTDVPVPHFNADANDGNGIKVSVVDTGWWPRAAPQHSWLNSGVEARPEDVEVIDPNAIHEYGGHGTFVAGVVRCTAPKVHIQVEGALTHGGAVLESKIVEQLHQAYHEHGDPNLISISAGTNSRGDFRLIAFDALMDDFHERGIPTLVIAAAGNASSSTPFWPAAFDWARGVGAVDPDASVAHYSNYGSTWVDVYARGTDHVNAFPVGTYTCYEPQNIHNGVPDVRHFKGLAQWSGTSFATPIVTGLVAAEMSRDTTLSPQEAFDNVVAAGIDGTDPDGKPIKIVGPLT
jgi:hypothetical protein